MQYFSKQKNNENVLEITLSAGAPAGKVDLKVPTSKLLIYAVLPKAAGTAALAAFETACATATVTGTRQTQDKGNKTMFEEMNLQDLLEIAATNEGFITLNTATDNLSVSVSASIELSNSGSVKFSQKDFATIQFRGFGLFTSFNVYSFGAPFEFDEHLKYSRVTGLAGEQVRFDCTSHYSICLPTTLTKLRLTYVNGVTQDIEHDEVSISAADANEIMYLINGSVLPYNKWRAFPLPTAHRGEMTLSANSYAYLLSNKNYEVEHGQRNNQHQ